MRSPKSYTKEDIVEINAHGGMICLRRILDLVISKGARAAEPGEFTKRAFLNGRIDLSQAEAVLDVINAKNEAALKTAEKQLKGELAAAIKKQVAAILEIQANVEASLDFPDEDESGSTGAADQGRHEEERRHELCTKLHVVEPRDASEFHESPPHIFMFLATWNLSCSRGVRPNQPLLPSRA